MRIILSILLCSFINFSFSQDDIPDYRSKKDNFSKVQEKDIRADLSQFTFGGISESLTKHRLDAIPLKAVTDDVITFSNDTVIVQITSGIFDPTKHKVNWYNDKYAVKLDNKPFWGTENAVPKHTINSIVAVIGSDTLVVPPAAFADLYEPNLYYTDAKGSKKTFCNVYRSADKRKYYIYMVNGDGSGRYEVTWVIQDKQYLRRVVDWGF
jgi:uncharacterized protein YcgL (UPF0745 family)